MVAINQQATPPLFSKRTDTEELEVLLSAMWEHGEASPSAASTTASTADTDLSPPPGLYSPFGMQALTLVDKSAPNGNHLGAYSLGLSVLGKFLEDSPSYAFPNHLFNGSSVIGDPISDGLLLDARVRGLAEPSSRLNSSRFNDSEQLIAGYSGAFAASAANEARSYRMNRYALQPSELQPPGGNRYGGGATNPRSPAGRGDTGRAEALPGAGIGLEVTIFAHSGSIRNAAEDPTASRWLQHRISVGSEEERSYAVSILLPYCRKLSTHMFGNQTVQRLLCCCNSSDAKSIFMACIAGRVVELSLQAYGCRVVQAAVDALEYPAKRLVATEILGNVLRLVQDQNGNHVVQRVIDRLELSDLGGILDEIAGTVRALSIHCFGCRVIQRLLENCDIQSLSPMLDELAPSYPELIRDAFGNYVAQHILRSGRPEDRSRIVDAVCEDLLVFSTLKFASNVVEKCIDHTIVGEDLARKVIAAAFGPEGNDVGSSDVGSRSNSTNDSLDLRSPILQIVRDPFGNYVVQKILASPLLDLNEYPGRREVFSHLLRVVPALRRVTFGRHVADGVDKVAKGFDKPPRSSPHKWRGRSSPGARRSKG